MSERAMATAAVSAAAVAVIALSIAIAYAAELVRAGIAMLAAFGGGVL